MDSRAKTFLARFFGRNKQLGHKGSVLSLNNPDPVSKALEIELINRCGGICMLQLPAAFEIPHLAVPVCIAATSEYLIEKGMVYFPDLFTAVEHRNIDFKMFQVLMPVVCFAFQARRRRSMLFTNIS